jgi:hypothetical protein
VNAKLSATPEQEFFYLQQASDEAGHPYREAPKEARLAVFGITLNLIREAIRSAIRNDTLTTKFKEKDIRPELKYIAETVDQFTKESSDEYENWSENMAQISDFIDEAFIPLNTADKLEFSGPMQSGKPYWDDYQKCFLECARCLLKAHQQVGEMGKKHLYPPQKSGDGV